MTLNIEEHAIERESKINDPTGPSLDTKPDSSKIYIARHIETLDYLVQSTINDLQSTQRFEDLLDKYESDEEITEEELNKIIQELDSLPEVFSGVPENSEIIFIRFPGSGAWGLKNLNSVLGPKNVDERILKNRSDRLKEIATELNLGIIQISQKGALLYRPENTQEEAEKSIKRSIETALESESAEFYQDVITIINEEPNKTKEMTALLSFANDFITGAVPENLPKEYERANAKIGISSLSKGETPTFENILLHIMKANLDTRLTKFEGNTLEEKFHKMIQRMLEIRKLLKDEKIKTLSDDEFHFFVQGDLDSLIDDDLLRANSNLLEHHRSSPLDISPREKVKFDLFMEYVELITTIDYIKTLTYKQIDTMSRRSNVIHTLREKLRKKENIGDKKIIRQYLENHPSQPPIEYNGKKIRILTKRFFEHGVMKRFKKSGKDIGMISLDKKGKFVGNFEECEATFIQLLKTDPSPNIEAINQILLEAQDNETQKLIDERQSMVMAYYDCLKRLKEKYRDDQATMQSLNEYEDILMCIPSKLGGDEVVLCVHHLMMTDPIFIKDISVKGNYRVSGFTPEMFGSHKEVNSNDLLVQSANLISFASQDMEGPKQIEKARSRIISVKLDAEGLLNDINNSQNNGDTPIIEMCKKLGDDKIRILFGEIKESKIGNVPDSLSNLNPKLKAFILLQWIRSICINIEKNNLIPNLGEFIIKNKQISVVDKDFMKDIYARNRNQNIYDLIRKEVLPLIHKMEYFMGQIKFFLGKGK